MDAFLIKWEYKLIDIYLRDPKFNGIDTRLNDEGELGWEFCAWHFNDGHLMCVLKRRK